MKTALSLVLPAILLLAACNKPSAPAAATTSPQSAAPSKSDAVQLKLQEYSGSDATDCGRFDVKTPEAQLKTASDCAMQAAQAKRPFTVAYDMPGMTVGIAGNHDGKLFNVQSQGAGPSAAVNSGACPSALRVASSGRLSCFAPGDMTSMSDSHAGGAVPPGAPNPHVPGKTNPHGASTPKTN